MARRTAWLYALAFFLMHKFIVLSSSLIFVGWYRHSFKITSITGYLKYALIENFTRWDAEWYMNIASMGYYSSDSSAFFPLYPYSIRGLSLLTGLSYRISGLLIASAAFLAALYILLRLLSIDFSQKVAVRTVLLMVLFPTSFYFSAIYTESLFLFWTVGCFYLARKGNWWWAGIFGFFASLTRNTGIILALPFLYEYMASKNFEFRRIRADIIAIGLIPAGIIAYMLLLYYRLGDPLGFVHAQKTWNRVFHWPWQTLWYGLLDLIFTSRAPWSKINHTFDTFVGYWEVITTFMTLLIKKLQMRWSYWLYMAAAVTVPLLSPSIPNSYFYSVPRFVIVLFPVFAVWAVLMEKHRRLVAPWLTLGVLGQVYLLLKFTQGWFIY